MAQNILGSGCRGVLFYLLLSFLLPSSTIAKTFTQQHLSTLSSVEPACLYFFEYLLCTVYTLPTLLDCCNILGPKNSQALPS